MFIVNRLAHYLKVLQREQIGSWKERQDLERELNVVETVCFRSREPTSRSA